MMRFCLVLSRTSTEIISFVSENTVSSGKSLNKSCKNSYFDSHKSLAYTYNLSYVKYCNIKLTKTLVFPDPLAPQISKRKGHRGAKLYLFLYLSSSKSL